MGFERTLKFMCWPWGVIYRLWYDYESFPRFVDDPKRVYIAIKDQKNFWWNKVFIEISDPNLTFFRDLWRILRPSGLFSYAYYWLKYNFRSFPQSLDDEKHVRIELMNIKNFCWKKSFHRNFWPKFDISHGVNMRKSHHLPTLSVKKNFETFYQKSASVVLSGLIWRTD